MLQQILASHLKTERSDPPCLHFLSHFMVPIPSQFHLKVTVLYLLHPDSRFYPICGGPQGLRTQAFRLAVFCGKKPGFFGFGRRRRSHQERGARRMYRASRERSDFVACEAIGKERLAGPSVSAGIAAFAVSSRCGASIEFWRGPSRRPSIYASIRVD